MNGTLASAWEHTYRSVLDATSELVTYSQDGDQVELRAIAQKPEYLEEAAGGMPRLVYDELEWIVAAADLVINGARAAPQPGAVLSRYNATLESYEKFEVRPQGGQQCFRRADPFGLTLAIHTKRVI